MDAFNKYLVGVQGGKIVIMMPPREPMSKEDALIFAAWIVVLADDYDGAFEKALVAVQSGKENE